MPVYLPQLVMTKAKSGDKVRGGIHDEVKRLGKELGGFVDA